MYLPTRLAPDTWRVSSWAGNIRRFVTFFRILGWVIVRVKMCPGQLPTVPEHFDPPGEHCDLKDMEVGQKEPLEFEKMRCVHLGMPEDPGFYNPTNAGLTRSPWKYVFR